MRDLQKIKSRRIAVIGAYGQVGRKVTRLLRAVLPENPLLLVGRDNTRLRELSKNGDDVASVDVRDSTSLGYALQECGVAINCSGPFLALGMGVAEVALETGTCLVDIASEQDHYRRIIALNSRPGVQECAVLTGAGAYPGITGMLLMHMLEKLPAAERAFLGSISGRPESPDDGKASILAAILEMASDLQVLRDGNITETVPGRSLVDVPFPPPFGPCKLLAWPQMEILALAHRTGLKQCETGVALGGDASPISRFLIALIRFIRPSRNKGLLYRILSRAASRRAREDYDNAIKNNTPPGAALYCSVRGTEGQISAYAYSDDMALATAYLPSAIAAHWYRHGFAPGARYGGFELSWTEFAEFCVKQKWDLNLEIKQEKND